MLALHECEGSISCPGCFTYEEKHHHTVWEARLVSEPVWMILLFCRVMKHSF